MGASAQDLHGDDRHRRGRGSHRIADPGKRNTFRPVPADLRIPLPGLALAALGPSQVGGRNHRHRIRIGVYDMGWSTPFPPPLSPDGILGEFSRPTPQRSGRGVRCCLSSCVPLQCVGTVPGSGGRRVRCRLSSGRSIALSVCLVAGTPMELGSARTVLCHTASRGVHGTRDFQGCCRPGRIGSFPTNCAKDHEPCDLVCGGHGVRTAPIVGILRLHTVTNPDRPHSARQRGRTLELLCLRRFRKLHTPRDDDLSSWVSDRPSLPPGRIGYLLGLGGFGATCRNPFYFSSKPHHRPDHQASSAAKHRPPPDGQPLHGRIRETEGCPAAKHRLPPDGQPQQKRRSSLHDIGTVTHDVDHFSLISYHLHREIMQARDRGMRSSPACLPVHWVLKRWGVTAERPITEVPRLGLEDSAAAA